MKVQTAEGLIERSDLNVQDVVSESDNVRAIATEWRHEGRLVRRDLHVIVLRAPAVQTDQGTPGA